MNVDEIERYPGLAAEREWLTEAALIAMPVLGVCLGAQLLARALGAEVRPGEGREIGFAPVEVHDPADPIVGAHQAFSPGQRVGPALPPRGRLGSSG